MCALRTGQRTDSMRCRFQNLTESVRFSRSLSNGTEFRDNFEATLGRWRSEVLHVGPVGRVALAGLVFAQL